jgi:hypothetical protein
LGVLSIALAPSKDFILIGAGDGQIARLNSKTLAITKYINLIQYLLTASL